MRFEPKDITGQVFNFLTAVERMPPYYGKAKRRITPWKFMCVCGNYIIRESSDVKRGGIASCGCKTKQMMADSKSKPPGVAASNSLFKSYKFKCAEERGYAFELNKEQFLKLTQQNCYYCNKAPSQIKRSKRSYYKYNGLDRVDNTKGYKLDNVVSCCKECNSAKSGITKELVYKLYAWFENEKL